MATAVAPAATDGAGVDLAQRELEKQTKIQALRQRLEADDAGPRAAQQLVQGGELESVADLTSDAYLHRWLRARAWVVDKAYASIVKHAEWRVANMPNGRVDPATIANELACEKVYLQGVDRSGRPIMIIQVRKHNGWTRAIDELTRFCCYALDASVAWARQHPELNPRGQCVVLLDLTDMGALSMDIMAIKTLFQLLGEHYVERLGNLFFWNPPTIFWGAWNTLSPLLPEATRQKIKVLDVGKGGPELLELIDPSVLPADYGGQAALATPLGPQQ